MRTAESALRGVLGALLGAALGHGLWFALVCFPPVRGPVFLLTALLGAALPGLLACGGWRLLGGWRDRRGGWRSLGAVCLCTVLLLPLPVTLYLHMEILPFLGGLGGSAPSWGAALGAVFRPAAYGRAFFPCLLFLPVLLPGLALGRLLLPRRPAPPDGEEP